MAEQLPPDWALKKAEMAWADEPASRSALQHGPLIRAFARYIADHEQPPVDPMLIEAREIVADFYDTDLKLGDNVFAAKTRSGLNDARPEVQQALRALRRGIEIGKAQA